MFEFLCGFLLGIVLTLVSAVAWMYRVMQGST